MRFISILSTALSAFLCSPTIVQAAPTKELEGSISIANGELLTLSYRTSDPFSTNWIALYPASAGPTNNEKPDSAALSWKYAPSANGTIRLDVETVPPGEYLACFLAREGYSLLAKPASVTIKAPPSPFVFIVDNITLRNARQGDSYQAKISGLINNYKNSAVAYQIISSADWVQLSRDGVITGIPKVASDTTVVIRATSSDKSTSNLRITIPVRKAGTPLVPELRVMTFNLWLGGTQVKDSHTKQVRFIASTNADIIGMQDTSGGHPKRLADALGWYYWQPSRGNIGAISRYPIVQEYGTVGTSGGVRISLDGENSQVNFWTMHLEWTPYGPYDFCFKNMTVAQVLQREQESTRATHMDSILKAMSGQLADSKTPVFLVGDTNAPSHLDWTEALRKKNCGYSGVMWPTSVKPKEAGMIDSFRAAHPDPAAVPGTTWSPLHPLNDEGGIAGQPEPQDRIDFIYHKGDIKVLESKVLVVGKPEPFGNHKNNEWTSDHAAVLSVFKL
ncbi:hypothetical protein H072_3880 [Dactylellina haptotyla CBS 200.50]|uniref:Endonuclease/exonuclease/phosphatase domain-containing protein n=1 Tax=Dactylellina haptotyla (strain CBS 200.50) TaxID=1284197 RepID=S8AH16_DACHA|nr:hypothetical protein H072_3880 [Dactylellina haptotyla CBS 200.50]